MAITQVKVQFDFEGEEENGELTIREGDIITVTCQDVGDGWWEGELNNGQKGLFPESYVEVIESNGVGAGYNPPQQGSYVQTDGQYQNTPGQTTAEEEQYNGYGNDTPEWDDNEWDEDPTASQQPTSPPPNYPNSSRVESRTSGDSFNSDMRSRTQSDMKGATVKRNLNRFSDFVKTGTEAFVLGTAATAIKGGAKGKASAVMTIIYDNGKPMWEPNPHPYQCEVRDPEKKSKFKGIKSFIAYTVIPDDTSAPVHRRYKHYDWLHDRLVEKFTTMCVPPLPDKQYYGRYGEDFVEKRREKLQMWTNRVARHPIMSRCDVFRHFLTCEEETTWKAGKRRAEKDEYVGGALLMNIEHPGIHVELDDAETQVDHFHNFHSTMSDALHKMRDKFDDHCTKMSGPFMREFHRMSTVFRTLSDCFHQEEEPYAKDLNSAVEYTSNVYEELSQMYSDQPKNDMLPALDVLKEYQGILEEYPDVQHLSKKAIAKVRGGEKLEQIDLTELEDVRSRAETVNISLLAEIHHFQHERVVDFKAMMQHFLQEQISFYQQIVDKLQGALSRYDD
jgi:sorting nexin-9/18/33